MRRFAVLLGLLEVCFAISPASSKTLAAIVSGAPTDALITANVSSRLFDDTFFSPGKLKIVTKGGVVTLSGEVGDLRSKERALKVAENARGVRAVVDRLELKTASRANEQIARDVRTALALDAATESYEVRPQVDSGRVTLTGVVDSWAEKQIAGWVAAGVKGVKEVRNFVTVRRKAERPDAEVAADIQGQLQRDPWIDPSRVKVHVKHGRVEIGGSIGSPEQRSRIYTAAWVDGVNEVNLNALKVDPSLPGQAFDTDRGASLADAQIKKAVKDAMFQDPRVLSFNPTVDVTAHIATLSGTVTSLKAKRAAEQDARNTVGVYSVTNKLRVESLPVRSDADLARDVRTMLAIDPLVDRYRIAVSADKGVVTLGGSVNALYERWFAEDIASRIKGVVDVRNELKVRSNMASNDAALKQKIERRISSNPTFDADDRVNVTVSDSVATLRGVVDSLSEKMLATNEALGGGAKAVRNGLQPRPVGSQSPERFEYSVYPTDIYNFYLFPKEVPDPANRSIGSKNADRGLKSRPLERVMRPGERN